RKISQAHIPPLALADVASKCIRRGSKYLPPTSFKSGSIFELSSVERRSSWHSLPVHSSFVTRNRSHPQVRGYRRVTCASGIVNRTQSMYVVRPLSFSALAASEEPKRRSITSVTHPTRYDAPSGPMLSSIKPTASSTANVTPG